MLGARTYGVEEPRFEILPFAKSEGQAAEVKEPIRLTVTVSPKHGVDHSVDFATRVRATGHPVTLHLAARMVRGRDHLDEILGRAAEAGIDDLFLIGGDAVEVQGPYSSAGDMIEIVASHPQRPATIGIGAYPEGHLFISDDELEKALRDKAPFASYMVTQLCFETKTLLAWLEGVRGSGIDLPLFVGAPGPIDRAKLLDISLKIGVGPSLRFLRKQRGLTRLFRSPTHAANKLYDEVAPHLGDPRYGMVGFHFFTFNELVSSWKWERDRRSQLAARGKLRA